MDQLYNLTTALTDVFGYIRNNEGKLGGAGRRLMATSSKQPTAITLAKAFVSSCEKVPPCLLPAQQLQCSCRPAAEPFILVMCPAGLSCLLTALPPPSPPRCSQQPQLPARACTGACVMISVLPPRPCDFPPADQGRPAGP